MLLTFKQELQHRTLQFIPTMHNTWKEEGWTLNTKLREYISKKHRLWTRYLETRDNAVLKKYKSVRNTHTHTHTHTRLTAFDPGQPG